MVLTVTSIHSPVCTMTYAFLTLTLAGYCHLDIFFRGKKRMKRENLRCHDHGAGKQSSTEMLNAMPSSMSLNSCALDPLSVLPSVRCCLRHGQHPSDSSGPAFWGNCPTVSLRHFWQYHLEPLPMQAKTTENCQEIF